MYEVEIFPGIELHRRAWIGLDTLRPESRKKVEAEIASLAREDVRSQAQRLKKTSESDSVSMIQAVNNGDRFDILFTVRPDNKIIVLDLLNHEAFLELTAGQK